MGHDVLAVVEDVLWNDRAKRAGQAKKQGRMRMRQMDDRRVVVRRVDCADRLEHRREGMMGLDRLDGELHIVRRDRLAVVELRLLDEVERQRQPVIGQFPTLGQVRMRLPVLVVAERRGENLRSGHGRGRAGLDRRIEVARRLRRHHHQAPAGLAIVRERERNLAASERHSRRRLQEKSARDVHLVHPLVCPLGEA